PCRSGPSAACDAPRRARRGHGWPPFPWQGVPPALLATLSRRRPGEGSWRSSQSFVFVVAARPTLGVVAAPLRSAVEQLPSRIQDIRAAVVARVGVVDDAVLKRERAQAVKLVAPEVDLGRVLRRPEVEAGAGLSP